VAALSFGGIIILIGMGWLFLLRKSANAKRSSRNVPEPSLLHDNGKTIEHPSTTPPVEGVQSVQRGVWRPTPVELRRFRFVLASELAPQKLEAIASKLRTVPSPPTALHKLVSVEFMARVTPVELSDIVMGLPAVAVKVLATANSPLYGLQQLVGNIEQAIHFLGMNTVRRICLQFILNDSVQTRSPEIKKVYERLWNESAVACELCTRLAQFLKLDEPGTFVTQIVLVCLGRQATYSLLSPDDVLAAASLGLLERSRLEQAQLGLASAEIGAMLMQNWDLPDIIINIVKEIDATLVTPHIRDQHQSPHAQCFVLPMLPCG
jgi:HD-like signal output (HDOD) protein